MSKSAIFPGTVYVVGYGKHHHVNTRIVYGRGLEVDFGRNRTLSNYSGAGPNRRFAASRAQCIASESADTSFYNDPNHTGRKMQLCMEDRFQTAPWWLWML